MRVDVKPFCASPELYPGQGNHQQQCWPVEEVPGAGDSCSGEYPILDIVKENRGAFLASEKATPTSADFQVAIGGTVLHPECSMTSSTGLAVSSAHLVSFLRFEEGPCDKDVDKDAEREKIVLDRSKPEHAQACTSTTYGGGKGTDGTVYTYPMDAADSYKSAKNVAASKKIKQDHTGVQFKTPGHAGNFYMEFTKAGPHTSPPLLSFT